MGGRGGGGGGAGLSIAGETAAQKQIRIDNVFKYTSDAYRDLNRNLREGKPLTEKQKQILSSMNKSMTTMQKETILYRAYGNSIMSQLMKAGGPGGIFKEKGLVSTSKTKGIFKQEIAEKGGWKAKIIVPKGTKGADINKIMGKGRGIFKSEKEVVLGRNTKFKIMKIDTLNQTMTIKVV